MVLLVSGGLLTGCGKTALQENGVTESETASNVTENDETQGDEIQSETENVDETETGSEIKSDSESIEVDSEDKGADNRVENNQEPTETEKEEYTFTELSKTMYVKKSVNVRSLPSTDGEKLGSLSQNETVKVTGKCNETGWYRINYKNSVAYVSNSYLSDERVEVNNTTEENTNKTDNSQSNKTDVNNSESTENEDVFTPTKEPIYASYTLRKIDSKFDTPEDQTGYHYEKGIRYFVWIANSEEENGGHWEKRFEGHPDNKWALEDLIPYLDSGFDQETWEPERAGAYDREEVRFDKIMFIYLGGGLLDKYK